MLSRLLQSSSNRIDDDDDASDADPTSEAGDALDAPLLSPGNDEDDADAAARREALRACCERITNACQTKSAIVPSPRWLLHRWFTHPRGTTAIVPPPAGYRVFQPTRGTTPFVLDRTNVCCKAIEVYSKSMQP